jgi:hypothetical protein
MLDAYLRYGDVFLDNLRLKLTSLKTKEADRGIIEESISEVSGVPAKTYIKAALEAQADGIMRFHEQSSG